MTGSLSFPHDNASLLVGSRPAAPEIVPDRLAKDATFGWQAEGMPNPYPRPLLPVVPCPGGKAVEFAGGSVLWRDLPPQAASGPFTLALWVRADERDWGTAKRGFPTLMHDLIRPVLVGTNAWALRLCAQRLEFAWGEWRIASQSELKLGRWHHIAVVSDGKEIRLFVDGRCEMLCSPIEIDRATGRRLRAPQITASGRIPEALKAGAAPITALSLAQAVESEGWLGDFRGALGGLTLEAKVAEGGEIARRFLAHRDEARKLSLRFDPLADPVLGGRSRRVDMQDEDSAAYLARTAWWRQARYGLFLHWAPCSLESMEISFGRGEGPMAEEYDKLNARFNPTAYDPAEWARIAARGGMKYVTLTAKHHDAFCLWPTKSGAKSAAKDTPCGKDIVGPYVKAMREAGLGACLYHSQRDARTLPSIVHKIEGGGKAEDIAYTRQQIEELCREYRPDVLWFDGGIGGEVGMFKDIIKPLIPKALVNDRNGTGDFVTPEGWVPAHPLVNTDGTDALWEICTCAEVFGEGGWSYHEGPTPRAYAEMVHELIEVAAKGGNCLRGFGPMGDGRFPAAMALQTEKIGRWLAKNGEAIYGTHRTRLGKQPFGYATAKADTVYLHVTDWPAAGILQLKDFHAAACEARVLASGAALPLRQEGDIVVIDLPEAAPDPVATVIAVRCEGA